MNNGDQPIVPTLMQRVGQSEFRLHKDGDPKEYQYTCTGLTKREVFAMASMQGIISSVDLSNDSFINQDSMAEMAVKYSDALLTELSKPKP